MKFIFTTLFSLTTILYSFGQNATIYGVITDENNRPIEAASITIPFTATGTTTNSHGYYELSVPVNKKIDVNISFISYLPYDTSMVLKQGQRYELNRVLNTDIYELQEAYVYGSINKGTNLTRIEIRDFNVLPSASGNIEALIKTMGASSSNELSSQYSVRGGNFDENLVYVNDVQIYRPFLVRSGQQEGLSFVNPDMVRSIEFSAGGFEARFGDKMSSVLDINYRVPRENAGSVSLSLLGGSAHIEGTAFNKKFTHLTGFRYKTTKYVLNSLDVSGNYKPSFYDIQSFLTFRAHKKLNFSFLGNYSLSSYLLQPEDRKTEFGTFNEAMNLKIFFEGQEIDKFMSFTGAFTTSYYLNAKTTLKLIASSFNTYEKETFDILGYYWINQIDNRPGSKTQGDSLRNLSAAGFLTHARNYLDAQVYSLQLKGIHEKSKNKTLWGVQVQQEVIDDEINEWEVIDSADYFIPYYGYKVSTYKRTLANNILNTYRYNLFVQNTKTIEREKAEWFLTYGLRTGYWDFNKQFLLSPRVSVAMIPGKNKNLSYFASAGYYYQPPFYKEFRGDDGKLNKYILAQKSVHFIIGSDFLFTAWARPFKLKTEIYYKHLDNLVPYKIDNVRIQYDGRNRSQGYSTGIEFKLSGEFVKGAQSWASLSFLSTKENILGDFYFKEREKIYPGYIRRPTDQLINFAMFFQDYFPKNPGYKFHLTFFYGTRLPTSNPYFEKYYDIDAYSIKAYKRLDIGFSKSVQKLSGIGFFKSVWLNLELLNAFGFQNVSSYSWIKTVQSEYGSSGQLAVPNYLTGRRLNGKITVKF